MDRFSKLLIFLFFVCFILNCSKSSLPKPSLNNSSPTEVNPLPNTGTEPIPSTITWPNLPNCFFTGDTAKELGSSFSLRTPWAQLVSEEVTVSVTANSSNQLFSSLVFNSANQFLNHYTANQLGTFTITGSATFTYQGETKTKSCQNFTVQVLPSSTNSPPFLDILRGIEQPNAIGDGVNYHRFAQCLSSERSLDGGCACPNYISRSSPTYNGGWYCACGGVAAPGVLVSSVLCRPASQVPPSYEIIGSSQINAVSDGVNYHRTATCSPGKYIVSGGCDCGSHRMVGSFQSSPSDWYCMCDGAVPTGSQVAYAICM